MFIFDETKKQIILDNIDLKNVKYIFLAGSLFEGFGNESSDIDVYVFINGNLDSLSLIEKKGRILKGSKQYLHNFIEDGIRYDIEYWSLNHFSNIVEKLNRINKKESNYYDSFSSDEYDLLHRLKYAMPIYNEDVSRKFLQSINFENLNIYLSFNKSELYSNLIEDVKGALNSKDYMSAFVMVRLLMEETLTAYLALFGETNPNKKWLFRKLNRYEEKVANKEISNKYKNLLTEPKSFIDEDIHAYLKETLRFCQKLNMETQKNITREEVKINESCSKSFRKL